MPHALVARAAKALGHRPHGRLLESVPAMIIYAILNAAFDEPLAYMASTLPPTTLDMAEFLASHLGLTVEELDAANPGLSLGCSPVH